MGIFDPVKEAYAVLKAAQSRDLHEELVSKTREIGELTRELVQCRAEIERQSALLAFQGTMRFRDNLYYATAPDGTEDGPYCTRCWDAERKPMRVHEDAEDQSAICPACDTFVERPSSRRTRPRGQ